MAPRYGGPSSAIGPMCRALAARGVQPLILTTDADGPDHLRVRLGETTSWQGVPAVFFRQDFSESFKYSRGLAAWLRRHVATFDIVHIHAVLSHAPLAAAAACRRANVPYVVRPLGTIAPWSLRKKAWRKRVLLALGARRLLQNAAAVHYTSEQEKLGVERAFGTSHGVVIPLGVADACLSQPIPSAAERARTPYVLALSRLHPKKNLETLIECVVSLESHPAWRLVIAGAGDDAYARSLERLVHERRAGDRVRFVGWVEGEAKNALIGGASLFAMPSLHENFGVSLIEAMAAGVPALVSRHVDLADDVARARAGWIVDATYDSVRRGLVEAIGDGEERDRRGVAARELAEQFAWPSLAARIVDLYRKLTAKPCAA